MDNEGEDDHYEDSEWWGHGRGWGRPLWDSGEEMDEDTDYEDRCEDMDKEDDNDHYMQTVVTINNCMWPWSRYKLICMVLHKPVHSNE